MPCQTSPISAAQRVSSTCRSRVVTHTALQRLEAERLVAPCRGVSAKLARKQLACVQRARPQRRIPSLNCVSVSACIVGRSERAQQPQQPRFAGMRARRRQQHGAARYRRRGGGVCCGTAQEEQRLVRAATAGAAAAQRQRWGAIGGNFQPMPLRNQLQPGERKRESSRERRVERTKSRTPNAPPCRQQLLLHISPDALPVGDPQRHQRALWVAQLAQRQRADLRSSRICQVCQLQVSPRIACKARAWPQVSVA